MNRVEILTSALADRRAELEQAQGKLAACELQLTEAREAYEKSNGHFETWQQCRDAMQFAERQLDRARQAREQCQQNVQCAETALSNAQRETQITTLRGQHTDVQTHVHDLATRAATLYAELERALIALDAEQSNSKRLVHELSKLDQREAEISTVSELLCARVRHNDGFVAAVVTQVGGFDGTEANRAEKLGLAKCNLRVLLELQPAANPRARLEQLARLGDAAALGELRPLQATEHDASATRRAAVAGAIQRRSQTLIEPGPKYESIPIRNEYS